MGFLGLTRYYKNFFHHYGKHFNPLTGLLKKNAIHWTPVVDQAFIELNRSMCITHVLATPNFNKIFLVESDASSTSLGAMFTQYGRQVAFTRKVLSGRNLGRSTYEKEMMAIIYVVHTWKPYLLGCHFHIKIDHHCLKYFLEQWLSSPEQNKWLAKILGYDYEIIYKKGKDNIAVHALSRKHEEDGSLFSLSLPGHDWIE
jgi:hypothetical protein